MPEPDYVRDGTVTYRRSFPDIRADANLARLPTDLARSPAEVAWIAARMSQLRRPVMPELSYVHDGTEIYRRSFPDIRADADLARSPADVARAGARMTQFPEAGHARV
jgi:hypothetical protein